jgi:hypothetical protein
MPVDFAANRRAAEEQGMLGSGGFFKIKEGDNRVRLLSECLPHQNNYKGQKSFKWLCYVIDRRDGDVKAFFMPHTIYKSIEALQLNPDYAFDDVPMPYDLTIHAKRAGTKEVEYSLIPARKESPLTEDEREKLDASKPLRELKAAIDEKQNAEQAEQPQHPPVSSDLDASGVPF